MMNLAIKQEEIRVSFNGEERKEKAITFTFNPDEIEMVRAKDGAYIIRQRRPRGELATFPSGEATV